MQGEGSDTANVSRIASRRLGSEPLDDETYLVDILNRKSEGTLTESYDAVVVAPDCMFDQSK